MQTSAILKDHQKKLGKHTVTFYKAKNGIIGSLSHSERPGETQFIIVNKSGMCYIPNITPTGRSWLASHTLLDFCTITDLESEDTVTWIYNVISYKGDSQKYLVGRTWSQSAEWQKLLAIVRSIFSSPL